MILEQFLLAGNETNCYVIACSETGFAAVIDPGEWNNQISDFIREQELTPKLILITHNHNDHTGGIEALRGEFDVRVLAHPNGYAHDEGVTDGQIVELGELKIKVLETPGHTDDSVTFVLGCDVFCGDLMFAGSVGGVPDRMSYDQEVSVIRDKILPLGDDMILHPGHGPATTVQLERLFNPFLIC
jgi:glyoxylase-like metal-dependent hydrolase (beta-lactamase superfamily II)